MCACSATFCTAEEDEEVGPSVVPPLVTSNEPEESRPPTLDLGSAVVPETSGPDNDGESTPLLGSPRSGSPTRRTSSGEGGQKKKGCCSCCVILWAQVWISATLASLAIWLGAVLTCGWWEDCYKCYVMARLVASPSSRVQQSRILCFWDWTPAPLKYIP